jgi:hypothetical protein
MLIGKLYNLFDLNMTSLFNCEKIPPTWIETEFLKNKTIS